MNGSGVILYVLLLRSMQSSSTGEQDVTSAESVATESACHLNPIARGSQYLQRGRIRAGVHTDRLQAFGELTKWLNGAATDEEVYAMKHAPLFIGVLSAPRNLERRNAQRKNCFEAYSGAGVQMKFFVGRPSSTSSDSASHAQGQLAEQDEIELSRMLENESITYGDIVLVPNRDYYRDTTDKLIWLYQYGLKYNVSYIAKVDDDVCLQVDAFQSRSRALEQSSVAKSRCVYMGFGKFNGTEYESMKGADGTIAPFMSGAIEILNFKLANLIFRDLANYAALYEVYGTSSEDANLGKWVKHVDDLHLCDMHYDEDGNLQGKQLDKGD